MSVTVMVSMTFTFAGCNTIADTTSDAVMLPMQPFWSAAVTVKLGGLRFTAVGVPESRPLDALIVRPGGTGPLDDHVIVPMPPLSRNGCI